MPRVRAKRWCFTLNNPTDQEKDFMARLQLGELPTASNMKLTYLCFGREAVSTPHLQGYLELEKKSSLSSMKTFLTRAHWEKAKGSPKEAADYCKKDGDYEEVGKLSVGQGYRTDLLNVKEVLDGGATVAELADSHFRLWVQYRRSFKAYVDLKATPRRWKTVVVVLWGDTGTGKTRFCHDQTGDRSMWTSGDYKWFDGYDGQEVVLWDDYRGEYPIQQFLKLTDRYPMNVPIKGGFTNWKPKKIYITSNCCPSTWYKDVGSRTHEAFMRRLDVINFINKPIY
ncbi:replication-associated protein [Circoviridae 5 LDMD-2013]|uniref:replication-associated protein n=1 Tax=Circoviridae 5 LDMD-2013 TaxID=1379709 RepID=UPI0003844681|nr:replication-associated protein [Circoviridae 5 LDMD-2013]AGS36190.1 replication-associated protein [Circoviridae 5 LDMD-2013]AGS36239.1 replication-associated protein [Circoviridae 20 LDMD-2013]